MGQALILFFVLLWHRFGTDLGSRDILAAHAGADRTLNVADRQAVPCGSGAFYINADVEPLRDARRKFRACLLPIPGSPRSGSQFAEPDRRRDPEA